MSSKSKTGKSGGGKSTGAKSVGPFVPEPLPPVTPVYIGADPSSLPFPEWSDQEVNSEKWDLPKSKGKQKPSPTPAQFPAAGSPDEPLQFVDPHLVQLPHSVPVHEWKRPSEVYLDANFIMYKESSEYPDLISGSKHLLHSDFMRSFISAIGILEYLGNTRPSPIEFTSPTFFPNTSESPWRPWHHIYSMCKAGKGQKHNPQVNTLGKYIVRLFWMGCWRKVMVDDLLPIDQTNHILLPNLDIPKPKEDTQALEPMASVSKSTVATESTKNKENKKEKKGGSKGGSKGGKNIPPQKEIEIWPFLLSKALLKIASLTWTEFSEILDFDIIHSLTGWFVQKIDITGLDVLDIWDMCSGYSDHYTWPDPTQKRPGTGSPKGGKSSESSKASSKSSKNNKGGKKKVPNFLDGEDSGIIPYHLVATCSDMRTMIEDEVPDISPCWNHWFLIDQTRDIPLIKPDPLPELARWKRFRWLVWAIRKGLWPAPLLIPIKCFKMVSVFKKCAEHVIYKPPSKEAIDIKKSVAVIEDLALKMGDGKNKGGKDKGKKKDKPDKDKSSKSSKSSSKDSSKKNKKDKKGTSAVLFPPDPSIWGDFNKLGPYISCLYIFFKSSLFSTNIKITNISSLPSGKQGGKAKADKGKKGAKTEVMGSKLLTWTNEMMPSRNEPIYIFVDSVDSKLVVINLAQVGNAAILQKISDDGESTLELDSRSRENTYETTGEGVATEHTNTVCEFECIKPRLPFAYAVVENYNWQVSQVGDMTTFLNTYGTKTMLIDVKPGRFVMRLWIKSDTSYNINLMSDIPMIVDTLEVVLESMTHEPERLQKMCQDISSTYGQLVQKFGTPQFSEGLIAFSSSYLPDSKLSKLQKLKVRNAFMQEFLNTLKESYSPQDFEQRNFALKVLFINPGIKLEQPAQQTKEITDRCLNEQYCSDEVSQTSEDVQLVKKTESAAVTLQAFFKKLYIRKLKALHSQSHKDYMKIFDSLKKIYTEMFSISKRMLTCPPFIRNFLLSNTEMSNFKNDYSLVNDLNSTIYLQHFTGNVIAPPYTWIPITRHVFYCNSPNSVLAKICLFCGFPKYMLRVFDNDTNQEIKRFTNNSLVYTYNNNASGYTVLCYGWSVLGGNFPWKLDFVTLKDKTASLLIVPQVTIHNHILKQNYRPNVNNIVCKCLVNINHDTLVTFRLSASYEKAKLCFRCLNEVGQVFGEICGTESVILPEIMLKHLQIIEDTAESITSSKQSISSKERRSTTSKSRSGSLVRTFTNTSIRKRDRNFDKMSLDRYSSKGSIISLKRHGTRSLSQDVAKYKDTVYVLEGFVIDDSWPLTKDEWGVAEEVKAISLLGPPVLNHNTLSSLSSMTKSKETISSRRSSDLSRKSSDKKRKSSELKPLEKPLWCIETISDIEDNLVAVIDKRREEEIKDTKRKWYENNPERYERSKQLREAYLAMHYIKWDISPSASLDSRKSVISENTGEIKDESSTLLEGGEVIISVNVLPQLLEVDEEMGEEEERRGTIHTFNEERQSSVLIAEEKLRTLKRPVSRTKMLPPLNLKDYILPSSEVQLQYKAREETFNEECFEEEKVGEEEIEKYVKTPNDEENYKILRAQAITDFELDQILYEEDMEKYLADQIGRNKLLDVFYKGCTGESRDMMQDAYDLREKVIDMIIEEEKAKKPPVKEEKKGKDKKNDKKGKKKK